MTDDRQQPHLHAGLSHRLVDNNGVIVRAAWWRAADAKELIGNCRQPAGANICPGFLVASYPEEHNGIWWYTATCLACDYEVVAPNGKALPRSSRRSEMPEGGWERRTIAIAGMFGKRDGRQAA